ncbi:MAG: hypothetical protein IKV44_03935 [Clostridia bacterium]|nr:hypothetical protein [Clostridia bacterium]
MKKVKKSKKYAFGCIALSVLLALSTYLSLVVLGVLAEDKKLNGGVESSQVVETVYVNGQQVVGNGSAVVNGSQSSSNGGSSYVVGNSQSVAQGANQSQSSATGNPNAVQGGQTVNTLLNTNKTKADIVKIYADVMNNAKAKRVGFKKVEYQELPDDPANRVFSEGEESAGEETIGKFLGIIEGAGVFVPKEKAEAEPYVHEKGDEDMSLFPVYNKSKGSYLTDPNGIESFTYELLPDGNVKMYFKLVPENNPEPVPEDSEVAPSYTGAVFSPMSKARIDRTINHPIITVFASNVQYSLRYHDCYVEVVFNPNNLEIISLTQFADVSIKGSGDVIGLGTIGLERQELFSTVLITDLKY